MPRESPSASDKSREGPSKASKSRDVESEDESGDENGEEYEIEEILDAKRGTFPEGRIGYYVKWKGYGPEENSWVDENDAANAKELVDAFWAKNPRKFQSEKLGKKGRQSVGKAPESVKKRGRKSTARPDSDVEMEKDDGEESPRVNKKARKSGAGKVASKSASAAPRSLSPEVGAPVIGSMGQYMHVADWETMVKCIDTVESVKGDLMVYFTLNNGEQVKEVSSVCKRRFPQKLLDFYEGNLRWRTANGAFNESD